MGGCELVGSAEVARGSGKFLAEISAGGDGLCGLRKRRWRSRSDSCRTVGRQFAGSSQTVRASHARRAHDNRRDWRWCPGVDAETKPQ